MLDTLDDPFVGPSVGQKKRGSNGVVADACAVAGSAKDRGKRRNPTEDRARDGTTLAKEIYTGPRPRFGFQ